MTNTTNPPFQAFDEMSAVLQAMKPEIFSGAMVLVTPDGETISLLVSDPSKDAALFLSTARTKIEILVNDVKEKREKAGRGYR
jgi:hypothetical protein